MEEKVVKEIILTLLLIGMLTLSSNIRLAEAIIVADDYSTIQNTESDPTGYSVVFIYSTNLDSAQSYKSLLEAHGVAVDLVPNSTAATWDYSGYGLIIIGSDTGWLGQWKPESAVPVIDGSGKPILGLGFGGSCFFDKLNLYIDWGQGWINPEGENMYVVDTAHRIFHFPNEITIPPSKIIQLYTSTYEIGIYMPSPVEGVTPLGRETDDLNHYPLIQEDTRYVLWGFTKSPADMTQTGKDLFINVALWLLNWTTPGSTRYPWSMFHHDLIHTGYTESPAPNTNRTQWTYTTGGAVNSSAAVVDGRVYVGSHDAKVYCLNASTGAHIWNYATGGGVGSSPAVVDGRVYVGSRDHKVYCLDASSGAYIWSYLTGGDVDSSPAVVGGKVYVGSYDRNLYCLDASSGAYVWSYPTGNALDSSPAVVDGRVYFGSRDCNVYCLNAYTGAFVWSYETIGSVYSSPAVVGGRVYVGSGYNVYCLDALTGAYVWDKSISGSGLSSPAVAGGNVYVGGSLGMVDCLSASTGAHIWFYHTTGYRMDSSPAVADGVVYIGSDDGKVYAIGDVIRFPEDGHATLQDAIMAANPEATVSIAVGVYHEPIILNKRLTILGRMGSGPVFGGGGSGIAVTLLSGASGSIVAGIIMTNWDQGILINGASNCKIYDNIMSIMVSNAITIEGTNAANNKIYSNIFQNNAVAINSFASSLTSTIYKNIITSNNVGLSLKSTGNIVYTNTISENNLGIDVSTSSNNIIYHNNFANYQNALSGSAYNAWDNGYPSGGNYWSDYTGLDVNSDGIGDTQYAIPVNNVDRYPLMKPFNPHDIGVTNIITSKTVVGQGFTLRIELKILNYGIYDETFAVTAHVNAITIATQTISLTTRNSVAVTFTWDTTGFVKGNYTIWAYAWPVQGETDTADNTFTGGSVFVGIVGDVNGNRKVDLDDVLAVALAYGSNRGTGGQYWHQIPCQCCPHSPNLDIDDNEKIDLTDYLWVAINFGKTDP